LEKGCKILATPSQARAHGLCFRIFWADLKSDSHSAAISLSLKTGCCISALSLSQESELRQQDDNATTIDEPNIPIGPAEEEPDEPIPDNENDTDDNDENGGTINGTIPRLVEPMPPKNDTGGIIGEPIDPLEMPLLASRGFNVTIHCNSVTTRTNAPRGSAAAVARGVANQSTMREKRGKRDLNPLSLSESSIFPWL
jgi:hypothetical protein